MWSSSLLARRGIFGLRLTCFFPPPQVRNAAPIAAINAARTYASDAKATPTEVSSILEQRIRGVQEESGLAETGRVLSVGYVDLCFVSIWDKAGEQQHLSTIAQFITESQQQSIGDQRILTLTF